MTDMTQVGYSELENIANTFTSSSDAINDMLGKTKSQMGAIRPNWIGRGSEAFFNEMDSNVLPAVGRLKTALDEAAAGMEKIMTIFKSAEEEGSQRFNAE